MGTQRKEGGGLESVLVLERDTKTLTHSTRRIRYSSEKKIISIIMCCWLFGPLNIIHIPIVCGSVENHDIFFKVCYKHLKSEVHPGFSQGEGPSRNFHKLWPVGCEK